MLHPTFAIRVPHKESQMIHSTQQLSGSALSTRPMWLKIQRWLMGTVLAGFALRMAFEAKRA